MTIRDWEAHFWGKVDRLGPDECWPWRGRKNDRGYGVFDGGPPRNGVRGSRRDCKAHRYAYELLIGPIPPSHELDHRCLNRGCVNPAHAEPITRAEHMRRILRSPETGRFVGQEATL